MTHPRSQPDMQEVLDFLNSIEGAGYGGMASFEIARQHVREAVQRCGAQTSKPAVAECSCAGDAGWPVARHDVTCPAYVVPSADQPPPKAWLRAKAEIDAGWPDTSVVTSRDRGGDNAT